MEKRLVIDWSHKSDFNEEGVVERIHYTAEGKIVVNGVETDDDSVIAGPFRRQAERHAKRIKEEKMINEGDEQ